MRSRRDFLVAGAAASVFSVARVWAAKTSDTAFPYEEFEARIARRLGWPVAIGACVVWLLVAKFARISSLAALAAFAAAPVLGAIFDNLSVVKLAFTIAVLVFLRHHENIRRLLAGTEPHIGQGKGDSGAEGNAGAVRSHSASPRVAGDVRRQRRVGGGE